MLVSNHSFILLAFGAQTLLRPKASYPILHYMCLLDVMFNAKCSFYRPQILYPSVSHLKPDSIFCARSLHFTQEELRLIITPTRHINNCAGPAHVHFVSNKYTESNTDPLNISVVPFQLQWEANAAVSHHSTPSLDTQSLEQRIRSPGLGDWSEVRCDKRSNGGVGRKTALKRDECKPNYHPQRIKYGRLSRMR